MGGGPNLTPYIIYQEVYLSPLSLWKTNIYIYIHSLSIYIYLSLSLYIYIYMRAGQTSPHMINNYKQRENHQDEVL